MNGRFELYHPWGYCADCKQRTINYEQYEKAVEETAASDMNLVCDKCGRELDVSGLTLVIHEVYDEES